jgi:hypothetical protein
LQALEGWLRDRGTLEGFRGGGGVDVVGWVEGVFVRKIFEGWEEALLYVSDVFLAGRESG